MFALSTERKVQKKYIFLTLIDDQKSLICDLKQSMDTWLKSMTFHPSFSPEIFLLRSGTSSKFIAVNILFTKIFGAAWHVR